MSQEELNRSAVRAIQALKEKVARLEQDKCGDIAIVGTACRFAPNEIGLDAYGELLLRGENSIRQAPFDRSNRRILNGSTDQTVETQLPPGAYIKDVAKFDSKFFGILPFEAQVMDPQQRLLLEAAWEALEDAGISPERLQEMNAGVFTTVYYDDYREIASTSQKSSRLLVTGTAQTFAAGRISHVLNLSGPSLVVNTGCSSSLVALHLACSALRNRECEIALVGGANLAMFAGTTEKLTRLGILSPLGQCRTLDASADGFSRGEGVGVVVLRRAADAARSNDRILAVIRGSSVNHDGRSSSLSAPNGLAQQKLLRSALQAADVVQDGVDFVELHGTGTKLGDPIEVEALVAELGADQRVPEHALAVGAVKANIGHTEAAAGLAGLLKLVLMLEGEQIFPQTNLNEINPEISAAARLVAPTAAAPWVRSHGKRRAGVSAFSLSGTNAHVVVEEAPERLANHNVADRSEASSQILCLSAKSETALMDQVRRMAAHIEAHPEQDLAEICFTANTARSHFAHRLAVLAGGREDLVAKLRVIEAVETVDQLSAIEVHPEGQSKTKWLFTGANTSDETELNSEVSLQGANYVRARPVSWDRVYGEAGPTRVPLPTYPFERDQYWPVTPADEANTDDASRSLWPAAVAAAEAQLAEEDRDPTLKVEGEKLTLLEALADTYARGALRELGDPGSPERIPPGVAPQFRQLYRRLREQSHGRTATATRGEIIAKLEPWISDPDVVLLKAGGEKFLEVISGRLDPRSFLFPGGRTDLMSYLYTESRTAQHYTRLLREALGSIAKQHSGKQTLKVLEVGAGTGGLTAHLLPVLGVDSTEYVFSDLSQFFLGKAQKRFSEYPFIDYQILDLDKPNAGKRGKWLTDNDVVIAANVLHATTDLRTTLQRVRSFLKPGGVLLMWELLETAAYFNITFGGLLQELADEDVRDGKPSLPREGWQHLLREAGFARVSFLGHDALDAWGNAAIIAEAGGTHEVALGRTTGAVSTKVTDISRIYRPVVWEPLSLQTPANLPPGSTFLIAGNCAPGLAQAIADSLEAKGHVCAIASGATGSGVASADKRRILAEWCELGLQSSNETCVNILYLKAGLGNSGVPDEKVNERLVDSAMDLVEWYHVIHASKDCDSSRQCKLWLFTHGAHRLGFEPTPIALEQSPLVGLQRAAVAEDPDVYMPPIDLDPGLHDCNLAEALVDELLVGSRDDEVARRGGQRYVLRLKLAREEDFRVDAQDKASPTGNQPRSLEDMITPNGTYLVAGGLGGLGLQVARKLVAWGARYVILVGRSGVTTKDQEDTLRDLKATGARVVVVKADLGTGDPVPVTSVLDDLPPLRGIVQSAMIIEDRLINMIDRQNFSQVLAPKTAGSWLLHQIGKGQPLDFFVLFSSMGALAPQPGQASYAAANSFLDAFAHYLHQEGIPAQSVNWGPWREHGFGTKLISYYEKHGIRLLSTEQGLEVFRRALSGSPAQVSALDFDPTMAGVSALLSRYWRTILQDSVAMRSRDGIPDWEAAPSGVSTQLPKNEGSDVLLQIRSLVSGLLRLPLSEVPADVDLVGLGIDSLVALDVADQIETAFGESIPVSLLLCDASCASLANEIRVRKLKSA